MKKLLIAILLVLTILIFISQQNEIDYFEYGPIKWEEFKKIEMKPNVYDITKSIKVENIELSEEKANELFPINETWPMKKYKELEESEHEYVKSNNIIKIYVKGIYVYNKIKKEEKILIDLTNIRVNIGWKMGLLGEYVSGVRFIDVKGEWITIMVWVDGYWDPIVGSSEFAYICVYQFNIITKQVFIYYSILNGIFVIRPDIYMDYNSKLYRGYPAFWEISKDHRYLYLAGRRTADGLTKKEIVEGVPGSDVEETYIAYDFGEKQYKMNAGVYALDLLKWRIYKLANTNEKYGVEFLCNNIFDGYFYYTEFSEYEILKYRRFKNAEEIMNKHR